MAVWNEKKIFDLGEHFVLAAERYDPRRVQNEESGVFIGEIASLRNEIVSPIDCSEEFGYCVFDTGDSENGFLKGKRPGPKSEVGSAKKVFYPGDVVISRLRPYLRQVALVDPGILKYSNGEKVKLVGSTEYYVLQGKGNESIAFLIPFLLSETIQKKLANSQEGGHHPRFSRESLLETRIPREWIELRQSISKDVETAIFGLRKHEISLRETIVFGNNIMGKAGVLSSGA